MDSSNELLAIINELGRTVRLSQTKRSRKEEKEEYKPCHGKQIAQSRQLQLKNISQLPRDQSKHDFAIKLEVRSASDRFCFNLAGNVESEADGLQEALL